MDEIALLQTILALIQGLAGDDSGHAREHAPYVIEQDVLLSKAMLTSPIFGLAELYAYQQDTINAVNAVRLDNASPHLATLTDVLAAIALLTPVTLPETPPPGYGGGDTSDVWTFVIDVAQMCSLD